MLISFITVNYYSTEFIRRLLESVQKSLVADYQFIIVNNSPDDDQIQQVNGENIVILDAGRNLGFGAASNLGLDYVYDRDRHAIVWLLNPDTWLLEDTLDDVVQFFATHSHLSIVGTMVYEPGGNVWFAGGRFNRRIGAIIADRTVPEPCDTGYVACDWVTGCSVLINLQHFDACPQFDPAYFLYYEDFDFCRRYFNQGHAIAIARQIAVIHTPSAITDRNPLLKLKHSTYSYLLTLERYTNGWILGLRLLRVLLYSLVLLPIRPQIAMGKLSGLSLYLGIQGK